MTSLSVLKLNWTQVGFHKLCPDQLRSYTSNDINHEMFSLIDKMNEARRLRSIMCNDFVSAVNTYGDLITTTTPDAAVK